MGSRGISHYVYFFPQTKTLSFPTNITCLQSEGCWQDKTVISSKLRPAIMSTSKSTPDSLRQKVEEA